MEFLQVLSKEFVIVLWLFCPDSGRLFWLLVWSIVFAGFFLFPIFGGSVKVLFGSCLLDFRSVLSQEFVQIVG